MKHLAFVFWLVACLIAASPVCAAPKDVTTVTVSRSYSATMHAATEFTNAQRADIAKAADNWRDLTKGRVDIRVVFDVDFGSIVNLQAHARAKHSTLIPIMSSSPIADVIDARAGRKGMKILAATQEYADGHTSVFLIVDRYKPSQFRQIVQHELGHVAGLPDLPDFGAIMSFADDPHGEPVREFTDEDRAFCRLHHYCE